MKTFSVRTSKRSELVDITRQVADALSDLGADDGVALVFVPHTTAGVTINENADPSVCRDMLATLDGLVPRDAAHYTHAEGNSDSHLKASLTGSSVRIPVEGDAMALGTWQGVYFAEFDGPRSRKVHVAFTPAG